MTAEGTFDLRGLIREVAQSISDPNPHAVAEAVLVKIADADLRGALAQCLGDFTRNTLAAPRFTGRGEPVITGGSSRKASAAAWLRDVEKRLNQRVNVGTVAAPQWRFLGECTRDDLLYAAGIRRRLADENTQAAYWYEQLAEELATQRKVRVRDLVAVAA